MLSRVAVSLYVLGGRLERIEHVARVLRVHAELALEGVRSRDDRFWSRLMDLLGWPAPGHVTRREAIELLVTGSTGPSLRRTVAEARTAAQAVRPSLSTDVFEQVNTLHWRLYEGSSDDGLHAYLRDAELTVQLVGGLVDDTMVHDEARDFMRLGKFAERGAATARLVTRKAADLQGVGDGAIEWGAALRCCSSFEAYRLRFVGPVGPDGVIGFLLCDRASPRSVAFCVNEALAAVRRVDAGLRRASAQDVLAELADVVDGLDPDRVAAAPAEAASRLEGLAEQVQEALRADYFLPSQLASQMPGDGLTAAPQQQQQAP
jgi:uncharacterized alpha-E superfamily protein